MQYRFSRTHELAYLKSFLDEDRSGFLILRGRRRIGKTWLLNRFKEKYSQAHKIFFFTGNPQDKPQIAKQNLLKKWIEFSQSSYDLLQLSSSFLTWEKIFESMNNFALKSTQKLVIIFDEIQWIGGVRGSLIAPLKEAWGHWQESANVKVILSGSSNKFFSNMAGGQDKILFGIETYAPLYIQQLSLTQLKNEYFSRWSQKEICLFYMMFGGIPQYILQFDPNKSFVESINDAAFTKKTIFPKEALNSLELEFNQRGKRTVIRIFGYLINGGMKLRELSEKSGLSEDLLYHSLEKLVSYELVGQDRSWGEQKNKRDAVFKIRDFFIHFYFSCFVQHLSDIKNNQNEVIFSKIFQHKNTDFIHGFSGYAFERLVKYVIEKSPYCKIHEKLMIKANTVDVRTFNKTPQIDLLLENNDKLIRTIECKWADKPSLEHLSQALYPGFLAGKNSVKHYLAVSYQSTSEFLAQAKKMGIEIIHLADLFS